MLWRKRNPWASLVAVALFSSCALIPEASVTPRLGPLDITGDVAVSSTGTSVSSSTEGLGFEEDDSAFSPRVDVAWGGFDLMLSGYDATFEGEGLAEAQLDLGTVIINQGDPVASELDLTVLNLTATYDFVPSDLFDLGIGIGARGIEFDGRIESLSTGDSIRSDQSFALPTLAARAGAELGPIDVSLIWSGLSGTSDGIEATIHDFDLMAVWTLEDFLGFYAGLVVGYRMMFVDVEYEEDGSDVIADLEIGGPYFGLTLGL